MNSSLADMIIFISLTGSFAIFSTLATNMIVASINKKRQDRILDRLTSCGAIQLALDIVEIKRNLQTFVPPNKTRDYGFCFSFITALDYRSKACNNSLQILKRMVCEETVIASLHEGGNLFISIQDEETLKNLLEALDIILLSRSRLVLGLNLQFYFVGGYTPSWVKEKYPEVAQ